MKNSNAIKSFSGIIESIRGVMVKDQMWIEIKLDKHKPYFRISKEDYAKIVKLIFVGHLTIVEAYKGQRHWFLVGLDNSFAFCITRLDKYPTEVRHLKKKKVLRKLNLWCQHDFEKSNI